jgi:hypothetical protein
LTTLEKDPPLYKNSVNRSNSVDKLQQSDAEQTIYERIPVDHPGNCRQLIGCHCTPLEESEKLDEERRKRFLEKHKGRNERRRLAKISRIQQQPAKEERDDWNPLGMDREDFEL